jgi:cold shock CspA family protein
MEEKTEIGTICSLRLEKGYAFIEVPGEHVHIFVHATRCPHWEAPLAIGDKVSFRRVATTATRIASKHLTADS